MSKINLLALQLSKLEKRISAALSNLMKKIEKFVVYKRKPRIRPMRSLPTVSTIRANPISIFY